MAKISIMAKNMEKCKNLTSVNKIYTGKLCQCDHNLKNKTNLELYFIGILIKLIMCIFSKLNVVTNNEFIIILN